MAISNLRGNIVAELTNGQLQAVREVDEFGVVKDGMPEGRKYGFHGTKQREALTAGGTIAMGVRLYVPQTGRFLQVDPVLGGTEAPYVYPSDPVNRQDLDGRSARLLARALAKLVGSLGKKGAKEIPKSISKKARKNLVRRLKGGSVSIEDGLKMIESYKLFNIGPKGARSIARSALKHPSMYAKGMGLNRGDVRIGWSWSAAGGEGRWVFRIAAGNKKNAASHLDLYDPLRDGWVRGMPKSE